MTQIPNSFNLDDLSAMLENAPQEDDLHNSKDNSEFDFDKEITPQLVEEASEKALDLATQLCPDPLVHKLMMIVVCHKMIEWHTTIAQQRMSAGDTKTAVCWLRDAGKFQSMMDSLVTIAIGSNDFTCDLK